MTIQEQKKKLQELAGQIRATAEACQARMKAGESLWADDAARAQYDAINEEYNTLQRSLQESENLEAMVNRVNKINEDEARSTRYGKPMPGLDDTIPGTSQTYGDAGFDRDEARSYAQSEKDKRNAMAAFLLRGYGSSRLTPAMKESCQRLGFDPNEDEIRFNGLDTYAIQDLARQARKTTNTREIDVRGLSKGGSGSGSELVPQTFAATFELAMLATSPMLAYVDTITTSTGENFLWPIGNDTAVKGAIASETTDLNAVTQTDPVLARLTLGAYDYHSRFIKVTEQLLRDSIVNVDQIVAEMLGLRIARILNDHFTVGTGSGQPTGVVTDAVNGRTTASGTAISYTDLIRLQHSVDPAYRPGGVFMAHDSVIATLRLLVDGQSRPLWQSGLETGSPDRLLGQPIIYNQSMASSVAVNNITMLYGDMSYYKVRRVGGMTMRRLVERFAETREVGFIGYVSADGRMSKWADAAVCPIKRLTQAAS